jgi:hypothetical protein
MKLATHLYKAFLYYSGIEVTLPLSNVRTFLRKTNRNITGARGNVVVEEICYKPEGRGIAYQ